MTREANHIDLRIDAAQSSGQAMVRLTFANRGAETACILDLFEPLPVFFSFHLARQDGTPISLPGGGKMELGPEPLEYVKLDAGQSHTIRVDLGPLLPPGVGQGTYTLSAEYHNQYGKDAAQRTLQSNTVPLVLTGGSR